MDMPKIMPFGSREGKSIEEIAIYDYGYFSDELVDRLAKFNKIKKKDVERRIYFVEYVLNNFVPVVNCTAENCSNPADYMGITTGGRGERISSMSQIYCSTECFARSMAGNPSNIAPYMIRFRTAISPMHEDTKTLSKIIARCMGIKKDDLAKEYLEEFIDKCELRKPYVPVKSSHVLD